MSAKYTYVINPHTFMPDFHDGKQWIKSGHPDYKRIYDEVVFGQKANAQQRQAESDYDRAMKGL